MTARFSRASGRALRGGGFTLLEILVTLALLSLLLLGMASSLRTMAQTEERVDQRLGQADEMRVAVGFVRTTLGRVSMRPTGAPPQEGVSPYGFVGQPDHVAWIGIMPARHGAGGRYFFRLGLEAVQGRSALVIRFVPWSDAPAFPDWAQAESRVLVQDVLGLALTYEDGRQFEPAWQPLWQRTDSLPERVRIDLQTRTGVWPLWVVPLRTLPASARGTGRFAMGPE
ncbi:MAG: prepilin-type N-terminal cleavage/methylation domain-containing protein [Burkholderiaceae bacterium]|nr:prepilin-type N-terminal cleavage/methylation domain-containing protein [Burkholderiaceae bacterium]